MKTKTGNVNGCEAVINLESETYVPIIGERRIAEYAAGGPWPYSQDPTDQIEWIPLPYGAEIRLELDPSEREPQLVTQTAFERELWQ